MVVKKYDKVDYEFNEISYGEVLDIQDDATIIDVSVDPPFKRLRTGAFTRALALAMVKKDGVAVDINNKEQCPMAHGAWIDGEITEMLSVFKAKNAQAGQKEAK